MIGVGRELVWTTLRILQESQIYSPVFGQDILAEKSLLIFSLVLVNDLHGTDSGLYTTLTYICTVLTCMY